VLVHWGRAGLGKEEEDEERSALDVPERRTRMEDGDWV